MTEIVRNETKMRITCPWTGAMLKSVTISVSGKDAARINHQTGTCIEIFAAVSKILRLLARAPQFRYGNQEKRNPQARSPWKHTAKSVGSMILPGISRTGAPSRPFACEFGSRYGENSVDLGLDESNINREETRRRGRRRWGLRKQRRKRKGPAIELPASDGARHYCPALQHPLACIASRDGSTTLLSDFSPLFLSSAVVKAIFLCQKKRSLETLPSRFFIVSI